MADAEHERAALFVEHARRYAELGWALIPLNGKVPRSRQWQQAAPEPPELVAGKWSHWGRQHGIGVNLGASGLAVLEDDTAEGRAKIVELLGEVLAAAPIVESGGRSQHRYYPGRRLRERVPGRARAALRPPTVRAAAVDSS